MVFLGGFMSDMTGEKAEALHKCAAGEGAGFVRFDYRGHGASGGRFEDAALGDWMADAKHVIDNLTEGNLILVGSSMGGWIGLHLCMQLHERVKGFMGIACAADFTHERLLLGMTEEQRKTMEQEGLVEIPAEFGKPYLITKRLIDEAARHLMLSYEEIPIECPVTLLHGMKDRQVPWTTSLRIAEKITGTQVRVILDKEGEHRMCEPHNLKMLTKAVCTAIKEEMPE